MAHLPIGAFGNSGQVCLTLSRSYVHRSLFDAVLERLATAVRGFVIGDPWQEKTHLGPIISHRQLARIDSMVQDAIASGARVVTGGSIIDGQGNVRSEGRRGGTECDQTWRARWVPVQTKKKRSKKK